MTYLCPKCGHYTMQWDGRAKVLLCYRNDCNLVIRSLKEKYRYTGIPTDEEIRKAIEEGDHERYTQGEPADTASLATILQKLEAEYQQAAGELHSSVSCPHRFTPVNATGKKSGLQRAIQIVRETMENARTGTDVTFDMIRTLAWMAQDLDARRDQGETGLDPEPLSPQMQLAHQLLEDLRAGKIQCRRFP